MEILDPQYFATYIRLDDCPQASKPEYAFIGRSNVGKSSLINMLCGQKGLARVSNTPGKTQTINYYSIDEKWFLVDLPGYGYARTGQKNRIAWGKMINEFLLGRHNLQCIFLLIDSNIEPKKIDLEFINWLGENQLPFAICYTKTDRLSSNKLYLRLEAFRAAVLESWNVMPQEFVTSAEYRNGREEILDFIAKINKSFKLPI